MIPQNGLSRQNSGNFGPSFDTSYNQLDGPLAKQMIALNQVNQARMNSSSSYSGHGGINSAPFLGGMQDSTSSHPTSLTGTSSFDSSMLNSANPHNRPPGGLPNAAERAQSFLNSLANVMFKQGAPLPPALTGIPSPNYDPLSSIYNDIEPSSEPGHFRLAGKDVDMFRLWGTVNQRGGQAMITNSNLWPSFLPLFDLPEQYPSADGTSMISIAQSLQQHYALLFSTFDEFYRKNSLDKQRMHQAQMRQMNGTGQMPSTPTRPVPNPIQAMGRSMNPNSPSNVSFPQNLPGTPQSMKGPMDGFMDGNVSEDSQGLKRKLESEEHDAKRVRQRTESLDGIFPATGERPVVGPSNPASSSQTTMNQAPRIRLEPSRRKIEYIPIAREVDTYGGRDMNQIESDIMNMGRRTIRELGDWGIIDIDSLTMSIRSRLSTELSYALTTFTLLSTMKGQNPNTGFPLNNAPDLFEEVLDLLEDLAFEGVEDSFDASQDGRDIVTHRQLVSTIVESESSPFAGLDRHKTLADHNLGLRNKPGTIILAIFQLIRNLCVVQDNGVYIARHPRALDLILRVCELSPEGLRPASSVLTLSELVTVRKDVIESLSFIAGFIHLSEDSTSPSKSSLKITKRIFRLVASYLTDQSECVTPFGRAQATGAFAQRVPTPPVLADAALEVFTRLGQPDANRQVFAKAIPQPFLWQLFVSLVRRLPIVDADYHIVVLNRDIWLTYLERLIMALYTLAFLSPPKLKTRMKTDRSVGCTSVMFRLVHKLLVQGNPDTRNAFYVVSRRAVETMKVLDDGADSFDFSETTVSTLSFGVGYGEAGENEVEKGTGLFAPRRDIGWDFILTREANNDEQMFSELESLLRVEF